MRSGGHKIVPDPMEGKKTHVARGATAHRAKHKLGHKISGNAVKQFKEGGSEKFTSSPKQSETDNVGRKMRPAAHAPVEKAKVKKREKLMKRLSDKVI